jgi:radical SAM protein with 4Fe4S-binding SPASM domain
MAISESDMLELMRDPTMAIFFSIDGPPEVHNAIRSGKRQENPYAILVKRLGTYKESYRLYGKSLVSSTVLTALDVRFDRIFTHLEELGFESLVFRPIRGSKEQPLGLNASSLPVFVRGYDSLIDHLERRAIRGDLTGLRLVLNPYDSFGRLLYVLLRGEERRQGCPGCMPGQEDPAYHSLVIDVNGDVYYPCRDFVCFNEYRIGNIYDTVDIAILQQTMGRLDIGSRPGCCTCWAGALCGGGCYNAAFLSTRQVLLPDEDLCELIRHLATRALQLLVRLHESQPDQLRGLVESSLSN